MILISTHSAKAQKGLYLKFSLGPGNTTEYSSINKSDLSVVTKNHAISWGTVFLRFILPNTSYSKIYFHLGNYCHYNAFCSNHNKTVWS